jgi:hypothetical protein
MSARELPDSHLVLYVHYLSVVETHWEFKVEKPFA